mmetsp:Transcript_80476/g.207145  ORF Transcript_80476/g.207145 Transcript_80476/m.207145 type:complete len:321 (-) Transcript_80476:48-1010(-)
MRAAVDLHQARTCGRHHHLGVSRTVRDAQCVKAASRVSNELLCHRAVGQNTLLTEEDEVATVGWPAVVNPDQCALVDTITRHVIHDVLLALEELLQEHCCTILRTALALRAHQQLEVGARLLHSVAELDAIGARGLDGLDDDGELLGLGERDNIVPDSAAGRAHRPQPRRLDRILLHALVAAIFHAVLRGVATQAHVLGERVRDLNSRLAAADDGLQLRAVGGLGEGLGRALERGLLIDLSQEVLREALRRFREVAPALADLQGPEGDDPIAALIQVRGEHGAGGVGVDDHDAPLRHGCKRWLETSAKGGAAGGSWAPRA